MDLFAINIEKTHFEIIIFVFGFNDEILERRVQQRQAFKI